MADHVAPGSRAYRPRHRRRREALPPLYDGQGVVAFADYLMEFRRVADFNGWTEDERCFTCGLVFPVLLGSRLSPCPMRNRGIG